VQSPMEIRLRILFGILASLLVLVGADAYAHSHARLTLVPVTCQEDEPCWNCATMGNRVCGVDSTVRGE
jgi:hypothetical protein